MAVRLGDYVEAGFLCNPHRNSTHGYLKLCDIESPIHFELTGDPAPELLGKALQFEPRHDPAGEPPTQWLKSIHPHQVGPTGTITIAIPARVPLPGGGSE